MENNAKAFKHRSTKGRFGGMKILSCWFVAMLLMFYLAFLAFRGTYNYLHTNGLKGVVEQVWEGNEE